MNTPIINRDLTRQAPHSPHDRFGGFAILGRTVDKCRASMNGKLGEYHYDCPLDNQLFSFKGINCDQFRHRVSIATSYEDIAAWLKATGTRRSWEEIEAWSEKMDSTRIIDVPTLKDPEPRKEVQQSCKKLGLDFETTTLFDWLDADDTAGAKEHPETVSR